LRGYMQVVQERSPLFVVPTKCAHESDDFLLGLRNRDKLIVLGFLESTPPHFEALGFNRPAKVGVAERAPIGCAPALGMQARDGFCIGFVSYANLHFGSADQTCDLGAIMQRTRLTRFASRQEENGNDTNGTNFKLDSAASTVFGLDAAQRNPGIGVGLSVSPYFAALHTGYA